MKYAKPGESWRCPSMLGFPQQSERDIDLEGVITEGQAAAGGARLVETVPRQRHQRGHQFVAAAGGGSVEPTGCG
ncbi:hypothetical protein GGI58_003368 [Rhizobium lentis]|nr:hypothetical protein [Rhizobium lentis]